MSKKSFKDNPAMAFITPRKQEVAQQETHEATQDIAQIVEQEPLQQGIQEPINAQYKTQQDTPIDTQEVKQLPRQGYVRTQGRKGHKKPRINLAFDSDELLNKVRERADKEGKSITQLMNEAIMIYLNNA